jgi:hypothetical protein
MRINVITAWNDEDQDGIDDYTDIPEKCLFICI